MIPVLVLTKTITSEELPNIKKLYFGYQFKLQTAPLMVNFIHYIQLLNFTRPTLGSAMVSLAVEG